MSTEVNRVYRLVAIRTPEKVDVEGLNPGWFESLETVTTIESTNQRPGHQFRFKIEKHRRKTPNQGEVTITNLSTASRDEFVRGPTRIQLSAGYDDNPRLLFLADLRYASNELNGTEWLTKMQLADGARAYAHARVNRSYSAGTPLSVLVTDLCRSFGVPAPANVGTAPEFRTRIPTGETLLGSTADELARILDPYGFGYSFQNGKIRVLANSQASETSAWLITTPENGGGMIGPPTIHAPKIIAPRKASARGGLHAREPRVPKLKVKHTLYPEPLPGDKIQLQSRSVNGVFQIESLVHEGDLFGDDWHTEFEATAV